jgi:hypothetical protein
VRLARVSPVEDVLGFAVIEIILFTVFVALVVAPLILLVLAATAAARRGLPVMALVTASGFLLLGAYLLTPISRVGIGALYFAVPPLRMPLVRLDLELSRPARVDVIRLIDGGSLTASDRYGGYELPHEARGLSVHGTVEVIDDGCGRRFFFMTVTGFSPDPYGGFQFVPAGCQPHPDPLGSGGGNAESLGGGWFWINAS